MADYDVFREQLGIMFPKYGHALWDPSPWKPGRPVKVGDVGFIRMGKFHCLFNALCPKGEQDDVPEGYEPLDLKSSTHITGRWLNSGHYCSTGVGVDVEQDTHLANPDDPREVSMTCSGKRGGALLSLPVNARREDTLAQNAFGNWIVRHIDHWFAFAQGLPLGIEQMEEIVLVTGCDRTRSWTNIAFLGGHVDPRGSYREKVIEHLDGGVEVQFSSGRVAGGVLSHGPQGKNLLHDDQCVFLRGFRVARTFKIFPKRLKAAAGPSSEPKGYECEPDTELMSIPATTKYRDPLHVLLDYIAERASDCDMVLVHDDDLERIARISEGSSLESLEPDVIMDLLRSSDIEIHKVCCDLSSTSSSPSSDIGTVWVAMLSMLSKNWSSEVPLPPEAHSQNPGPSPRLASEAPVPLQPPVQDRPAALLIPGDTSLCDSAPLGRVSEINLPALDKIRQSLSGMWSSLNMLAHVERLELVATVVVVFFATALFGWIFSFNWLDISKYWFTVLLASFTLRLWFEREHTRRRLDEMHERMAVLQRDIMSLQSNPTVTTLLADARSSLPIMAKTTPTSLEVSEQSTQLIVQPAIASPSGHGEPRAETSYAHRLTAATPQESTRNLVELELSNVNLVDSTAEQQIEHIASNTVSGSTHAAEPSHSYGWSVVDSGAEVGLLQSGEISKATPISRNPAPHILAELPIKPSENEPLRIDSALPPSPEHSPVRPGLLNPQTTTNINIEERKNERLSTEEAHPQHEAQEKAGTDHVEQEPPHKLQEEHEASVKEAHARREVEEGAEKESEEQERLRNLQEGEEAPAKAEGRAKRKAQKKAEKKRAKKEQLRKLQEEEEARGKEEAERQRKEEEERLKIVEASENANALPDDAGPTSSLPAEGEIEEVLQATTAATDEPASAADKSSAVSRPPSQPGPLNLQMTNITPTLPSALATARYIEDVYRITYPIGIKSPKLELNVNTQKGKFRYDREFLLQFMNICKEAPDNLPPLDVIGLEPSYTSHTIQEVSDSGSEDESAGQTGSPAPAMSEAESIANIQEHTKEFFNIRMLDEGETYFSSLPSEHRHLLVDALVTKSIEMKEPDVVLVSELFVRVREKELCSPADFEEGFNGLAEFLDDLAVDIPKAWPYFAILLRGSGLDQDEERRGRIAEKTMDPDKLDRLL